MKKVLLIVLCAFAGFMANAQVGIGIPTPDPSAALEISAADKGVLIPQVALTSLTDNTTITAGNVNSLLVYNTATVADELTPGYYYWLDTEWKRLASSSDIYSNVYYDGTNFHYINNAGDEVQIDLTQLIQENQLTYEITSEGDNVVINKVVDPNDPNNITYNIDVQSAMPQFFYMPAILFDTSVPGAQSKALYAEYVKQFTGSNNPTFVSSTGAPAEIPILPAAADLYYYVTHYDEAVIDNVTIDANGVLSYDVISSAGPYSYISIVFVVKNEPTPTTPPTP